jgi:hypothetical protein
MEILILGITVIVNCKVVNEIRLCEDEYCRKSTSRDAKGEHIVNALTVDAGIEVSKVYAKRVLGDATGLTKAAFREEFTKLGCFIDYMNSEGNDIFTN